MDMSSSKMKDCLPGFVPLYIGMPIVLKCKNISTDLGITNGSQGYVCALHTGISSTGFTYCSCVLVEFPDSKVTIPGLPMEGWTSKGIARGGEISKILLGKTTKNQISTM